MDRAATRLREAMLRYKPLDACPAAFSAFVFIKVLKNLMLGCSSSRPRSSSTSTPYQDGGKRFAVRSASHLAASLAYAAPVSQCRGVCAKHLIGPPIPSRRRALLYC